MEQEITTENHGKRWTSSEKKLLIKMFDAGDTVYSMSNALGRTNFSIKCELAKLGKIEPFEVSPGVVLTRTGKVYKPKSKNLTCKQCLIGTKTYLSKRLSRLLSKASTSIQTEAIHDVLSTIDMLNQELNIVESIMKLSEDELKELFE